ncbi:MAG: aminotransferase class I/II-fold pyridoxal phosphate-dependent enzyme [Pseudanabaenaceae cyanobacterium]
MLPLLEFAKKALRKHHSRFYFPGHKGGQGLDPVWAEVLAEYQQLGKLDFPELVGLWDAIAAAERLAAEAYGAKGSFFLVNGSTQGVQSALLAVVKEGDRILVGRNFHQSVLQGLILTGAKPIYLPVEYDRNWRIDLGVSPATLRDYLKYYHSIKAVFLTSPNYFGVTGQLAELIAIAHRYRVPVIVDAAHGAHLGFHPDLPPSAIQCGADIVIHSTHKTCSALSQASMLHWQGDLVSEEKITQAVQTLQTTSPNFILLLSLDIARWQLQTRGKELLQYTLELVGRIKEHPPLPVFHLDKGFDTTRVTVSTKPLGLRGFQADQYLSAWGVVCELPTFEHLVFSFSVGTTAEDVENLLRKMHRLFSVAKTSLGLPSLFVFCFTTCQTELTPRQAFFAPKERVDSQTAIGRISGETICPYPPGIPVLMLGEKIAPDVVRYLKLVKAAGGLIRGASDPQLDTWLVLKE